MLALSLLTENSKAMQLKNIILFVISASLLACNTKPEATVSNASAHMRDTLVKVDGKDSLLLLADRPPNLETPLKYFLEDYTPNNVFFVRWHLSGLPSKVDTDTFRLRINGNVNEELALSVNDLKTKFTPFTITALCQCAGNARSFFDPRVPGGQWKNGAMGNAKWTGVKLSDILAMAKTKKGSIEVAFNGLDKPPMDSTPDFVKSLPYNIANNNEVMVAYEMNGEPLPMLNGYPLKLVVPGWYATYWIGMLSNIQVLSDTFKGFWMQKAYLIPKESKNGDERPDSLAKTMQPINKMDVRSIFVSPEPDNIVAVNKPTDIQGLAFDGGYGIAKVEVSEDGGKTWKPANLDNDLGKYSWRRWHYAFNPSAKGSYTFKVKATNEKGETQPEHQWNRSGYMRNEIETLNIKAE